MIVSYPLALGFFLFWCVWWIMLRPFVIDLLACIPKEAVFWRSASSAFLTVVLVFMTVYSVWGALHYAYHFPEKAFSDKVMGLLILSLLTYDLLLKKRVEGSIEFNQHWALVGGRLDVVERYERVKWRLNVIQWIICVWGFACLIKAFFF